MWVCVLCGVRPGTDRWGRSVGEVRGGNEETEEKKTHGLGVAHQQVTHALRVEGK